MAVLRTYGLALAVGCYAAAWLVLQVSRPETFAPTPLIHDFGDVEVGRAGTDVSHVFRFRNQGDETLRVLDVKASCGCIETRAEPEVLEPGETLSLYAAMKIASPGEKRESLAVIFDGRAESLRFHLMATGRTTLRLCAFDQEVILPRHGTMDVPIHLIRDHPGPPPVLECRHPDRLQVVFQGWHLIHGGRSPVPYRWEGILRLAIASVEDDDDSTSIIPSAVPDSEWLETWLEGSDRLRLRVKIFRDRWSAHRSRRPDTG